jgi:hypothetical protein
MIEAKIVATIILTILGGTLYHLGGTTGYNRLMRMMGVPAMCLLNLWVWNGIHLSYWWGYFLSYGLMVGAISTYWKASGSDARWWNWLLHGLGLAIATLPYQFNSGHWIGFGIRCIVLPLAIMIWSEKVGAVNWEEGGRGGMITLSMPIISL